MPDPIRIPLVEGLEPRLSDSTKDGLASNVFYDKNQAGTIYATKRPGITSYLSATGQASGVFGWNNDLFRIWMGRRYWGAAVWTGTFFILADRTTEAVWDVTRIGKSFDGLTWSWTSLEDATAIAYNIAWDGDYLMFPKTTAGAFISQDGINWSSIVAPIAFTYISAGNTRFFGSNASATYVSSNNGTSWTLCVPNVGTLNTLHLVYHSGNSTYVGIPESSSVAYTSTDGINFTQNTIAGGVSFYALATNGTRLCALSSTGDIYHSTNGTSWTLVSTSALSTSTWTDITWTGSMFVASNQSQGSGQILTSTDGLTWTKFSYSDPFSAVGDETYIVRLAGNSTITIAGCFPSVDGDYLYFTTSNSEVAPSNLNPPESLDGYIQLFRGGVFVSETPLV